jgi:hypothetical protein
MEWQILLGELSLAGDNEEYEDSDEEAEMTETQRGVLLSASKS